MSAAPRALFAFLLGLSLGACCMPQVRLRPPNDREVLTRISLGAVTVRTAGVVIRDGRPAERLGVGSGAIVWRGAKKVLILTCHHVVHTDGEETYGIMIESQYGGSVVAAVFADDPDDDLALLAADDMPLADVLAIATRDPKDYERLYAFGSPKNHPGTAADAILSNHLPHQGHVLYQITSFVYPGSSGGILANLDGELVGVLRAIAVDENTDEKIPQIGYAVPLEAVQKFLKRTIPK